MSAEECDEIIERLTNELAVATKERSKARHQVYEASDMAERQLHTIERLEAENARLRATPHGCTKWREP